MRPLPLKKRLRYALETVGAYVAYGIFAALPPETASDFGGFVLRRLGPRMGVSRTAMKNIARAMPEMTEAQREKILDGMWDNLGRVIGEYPHLKDLADKIEIVGLEHLAASRGRGSIFFSGHIGNWEICAVGSRREGIDSTLVYRRPNNLGVDGLLTRARGRGGAVGHIAKGPDGAREIISVLKRGGTIGILVDQRHNEGFPIPFFGRDAMTAPAAALFALKFGCPLYPLRVERLKECTFRLTIYPALKAEKTGDTDADVRRLLTEMNGILESWVRERPEQWLWIHKRWPEEK